uniref:Aspartyl beta-hydroxylase/Triadin domain-containing protein n=1 Tax=Acanthochromis polyacanthus TaxID=80966 RepID=A0A3Q1GQI5_9TELE
MAQRKNPKAHSRKEGKTTPVESKNGKRTEGGGGDAGGGPKFSMFTWFVVLALLGVWSSVAVVYFDIVDYDSVIARAKEFRMNFSEVLQGKLTAYDTDGDGDFDVEDAKVLLGLKEAARPNLGDSPEDRTVLKTKEPGEPEPKPQDTAETTSSESPTEETASAAVPLPPLEDSFIPDDPGDSKNPSEDEPMAIDTTGVLVEEPPAERSDVRKLKNT